MNVESFSQQIAAMHNRLFLLLDQVDLTLHPPAELSPSVLKEMGVATEELQVAIEELEQQNEALVEALETAAVERKRYQNLFQFAPEAYLVTDLEGNIQEANWMATEILGMSVRLLVGESMSSFLSEGDRSSLWTELTQRQQRDYFQEWEIRLEPHYKNSFDAACIIIAIRDSKGNPTGFHWVIRDITERKRIASLERNGHEANSDIAAILQHCPLHWYNRGDWIPLHPQTVWYITQGLIKLTNLTEQNKEVLLGLIGPGMLFGAYLTSLPLYEATALSDVHLVAISMTEISASCQLAQLLMTKTCRRLRQTEALLAISGERQIEARLYRLLQLLKDEVGQPVAQGTRLSIRLTHEDLSSACCTTRVTISHLLSKLQQQGKITFDQKKHIILIEDVFSQGQTCRSV